jgi:hypothetical protein
VFVCYCAVTALTERFCQNPVLPPTTGRRDSGRRDGGGVPLPLSLQDFVLVIAMLETSDFFQVEIKIQIKNCEVQIKKCESLAARAVDKSEREFWVRLAHRWKELLRARQCAALMTSVPLALRLSGRFLQKGQRHNGNQC